MAEETTEGEIVNRWLAAYGPVRPLEAELYAQGEVIVEDYIVKCPLALLLPDPQSTGGVVVHEGTRDELRVWVLTMVALLWTEEEVALAVAKAPPVGPKLAWSEGHTPAVLLLRGLGEDGADNASSLLFGETAGHGLGDDAVHGIEKEGPAVNQFGT